MKNKNQFIQKKSFGQNFLVNPRVAERIAKEADISKKDIVLEIGPGTGKLTEKLLEKAKTIIAVEKDDKLILLLKEKFSKQIRLGSLVLAHNDILDFDIDKARQNVLERTLGRSDGDGVGNFSAENFHGESENILPSFTDYKIVANIPYNITGAILKKFLSEKNQPKSMTLMVQREVAERIIAKDGKESLLSVSVKSYGEPKILFKVSRGNFYPAPNVDSAVIGIKNISRKKFQENKVREDKFWKIVKAGFAHKRKKLAGNLKGVVSLEKKLSANLKDKRAEDLSISDWIFLAKL